MNERTGNREPSAAIPYYAGVRHVVGEIAHSLDIPAEDLATFRDEDGRPNLGPISRDYGRHVQDLVEEAAGAWTSGEPSDHFDSEEFTVDPIINAITDTAPQSLNNGEGSGGKQDTELFSVRLDTNRFANHSSQGKQSKRNDQLRKLASEGYTRANRKYRRRNPL